MSTEAFTLLTQGKWLDAIIKGYTSVMGDFFFLFIALGIIIAVQFKTESAENTSVVMLIMGGIGLTKTLLPAIQGTGNFNMVYIWGFMVAMGLALPFFKFTRED